MVYDATQDAPLIMYDQKSRTIYMEWRRGIVADSVHVGEAIVIDYDAEGNALGTECYLDKIESGQSAAQGLAVTLA